MTTDDAFDPETLRLPGTDLEALPKQPPKRLPRHRPGEHFLKGPIPWSWLVTAAQLPGKALQVTLLLWKVAGCRKDRTVPFCLAHGQQLGMSRKSARYGLRQLKAAGLVSIRQLPGHAFEVTLLDWPAGEGGCSP
jgi:hypothetical protein